MVTFGFVAVEFSAAAFQPSSSLFGEAPVALSCVCAVWVGVFSWVASCNPGLSPSVSSLPGVTKFDIWLSSPVRFLISSWALIWLDSACALLTGHSLGEKARWMEHSVNLTLYLRGCISSSFCLPDFYSSLLHRWGLCSQSEGPFSPVVFSQVLWDSKALLGFRALLSCSGHGF